METLNTNMEQSNNQSKDLAREMLASINGEAEREYSLSESQVKFEKELGKEQALVKSKIDRAVEGKFGAIQKITHKEFDWGKVTAKSNIIDLGEVKLAGEKTHDEKMQQANEMLAQVGLEQAA